MDRQEFLKQQYVTLREEIRETKARIFRIMGFGLIVVPAANALANIYHLDVVNLVLPLLIFVVALVYVSEVNALMRCGRYIKQHIESTVQGLVGWEEWLEENNKTSSVWNARNVDTFLAYAFYLLFAIYFLTSVFIAWTSVKKHGVVLEALLLGTYSSIGLMFFVYLLRSLHLSTVVRGEANEGKRKKLA